jgi:hypothetical protein
MALFQNIAHAQVLHLQVLFHAVVRVFEATSANFAPVAGEWMSNRVLPLTHWPLIKAFVVRSEGSLSCAKGEFFTSMGLLGVFVKLGSCACNLIMES